MKKFIMVLMFCVSLGAVTLTDVSAETAFDRTVEEIKEGYYRTDSSRSVAFDAMIDEHLLLENDSVGTNVEMIFDQAVGASEFHFLFVSQDGEIDETTAIPWQANTTINVGEYLPEYDGLYIETEGDHYSTSGMFIYNLSIDSNFEHADDEDINIEFFSFGQGVTTNSIVYWHKVNISDSQPIANDVDVVGENNSFVSNNILENDILSADETKVESFKIIDGEKELSYSASEMINGVEIENIGVVRFNDNDMTVELVGEGIDEDKSVEVEYMLVDSDGSNSSASMIFNLESTVVNPGPKEPEPKGPTLPNTGSSNSILAVLSILGGIVCLRKRFTS